MMLLQILWKLRGTAVLNDGLSFGRDRSVNSCCWIGHRRTSEKSSVPIILDSKTDLDLDASKGLSLLAYSKDIAQSQLGPLVRV
jgi:hypothetical protein